METSRKLNVLFVDDERRILDGLRNRLRRHRKTWNTHFLTSGAEALEFLKDQSMDVVVSDMRMPSMDGAELLGKIQKDHGATVRIVLSGHAELEAAMRVMPVAHQFLAKPCDACELANIVERAYDLQCLLQHEELLAVVTGIDNLPAIPVTYQRLVVAIADENSSAKDLAKIIQADIGISAKVIRVANSSFFANSRSVADLESAVVRLGFHTVKSLVMGMEVFTPPKGASVSIDMQRLQERAFACAHLAQLLSPPGDKELAFMSGMLHELGQLILACHQPEMHALAARTSKEQGIRLHTAEEQCFGVSHAEVGAYLLGLWGLPYPVIEAVAFHHHPERVKTIKSGVFASVHVASELTSEECVLNRDVLRGLGMTQSDEELQALRNEHAASPTAITFEGAA